MMARFISPFVPLVLLLFALLMSAALVLGSGQAPPSALAGFAPCANNEWCWFGISPERTSLAQAEQILFREGYSLQSASNHRYTAPRGSNLCDVQMFARFGDMNLFAVVLECDGVSLGDLTSTLGLPTGIAISNVTQSGMSFYAPPAIVFGEALLTTQPQWTSLYSELSVIWFMRTSSTVMTVSPWDSFNNYRLCQYRPLTYGC